MEYYLKQPSPASEIERNSHSDKALGLFRHGVVANVPQSAGPHIGPPAGHDPLFFIGLASQSKSTTRPAREPRFADVYDALVAQLDRASDYESEGWEFESLRARHLSPINPPRWSRLVECRVPSIYIGRHRVGTAIGSGKPNATPIRPHKRVRDLGGRNGGIQRSKGTTAKRRLVYGREEQR